MPSPSGRPQARADNFLCQGETRVTGFARDSRGGGMHIVGAETQCFPRFLGEAATDDQRNAAAGLHLVEQYFRLQAELADDFAVLVFDLTAFVGLHHDHVAHGEVARHRALDGQRAGVFQR